ncbi:MAG TPA: radical SAM protein [Phycisphaerae bacterium]|nr:radical SAM protein [Phycisphaerae bacterium]HNU45064.1 radical SAM protein [Phycisphaerae bacterium]
MHDCRHHVFGPVPSRRLGRSLGVDLVPYKTCPYDCIYCQLGATTHRTIERGPYVAISGVLRELEDRFRAGVAPDYITLSGSGEPTLQEGLALLISGIRRLSDRPIAVLTNGALLWRQDVQAELLGADLVIPSLDAGDEEMFQRVNRPHPQLRFEQVVEGLRTFCRQFHGQVWLEVFLLAGLTTAADEVQKIGALLEGVPLDRIQLNTVSRPPSEAVARPASVEELLRAARLLGERAEVIAEHAASETEGTAVARAEEIIALLQRRPCTLDDLVAGLGVHRLEAAKHVERLVRAGVIVTRQHGRQAYYQAAGYRGASPGDDCAPDEGAS